MLVNEGFLHCVLLYLNEKCANALFLLSCSITRFRILLRHHARASLQLYAESFYRDGFLRNTLLGKKPEEHLNLERKEITPIIRKLNAFTEKVREDIEKKRISEADGQKLILKAIMMVRLLTTT